MFSIARADFTDPALTTFLEDHLRDLHPTAPAESRHALDLAALQGPETRLWVAHSSDVLVGTVALVEVHAGHDELKSMRTAPSHRGQAIASRLLDRALEDARERGITQVSLETGSMPFFAAARELYRRSGFVPCPPFGNYAPDPHSVFMTRILSRP